MISSSVKRLFLFAALSLPAAGFAEDWQFGGHIKYQPSLNFYDADSIFGSGGTATAFDQNANLRLKAEKDAGDWDYRVHYELGVLYGPSIEALRSLPPLPVPVYGIPTDQYRLFDLTSVIYNEGRTVIAHRLDRLSAGYAKGNFVFRAGRDAVSWGNGVLFQPMDIFNPFSPTAIDKEYKSGDDMAYAQWLFDSGNDLQMVAVPRRNSGGSVDTAWSSLAAKYHGKFGVLETDLLVARHFDENLAGVGFAADWGGAVIRNDNMLAFTPTGTVYSGVANITYSWVWREHNVSGFAEYFRNGFGISDGDYTTLPPALTDRLVRGELFNLGQDNLVSGATIELTPRWQFTPTLFVNINDGSALLQFAANYDWKQNGTILIGGIVPAGPQGTEYGGIPIGGGNYYRPAISVYGQVAYYF